MYLFSYGTLQEKYIQEGLFGNQIPMINGRLEGYALRLGEDGYYNLEPALKHCVEGKLLKLDDVQILCADQWEEVPVYERALKQIVTQDGLVEGWVFFKTKEQLSFYTENIQDSVMTSGFESEELSAIFNSFLELKTMKTGFTDVYCAMRLSKEDFQNKKTAQNMPNDISELMIFSLSHEGYDIKHIAFIFQVSRGNTYVIVGVPVSIRSPRTILEGIRANKALLESTLSVTLMDSFEMISFDSYENTMLQTQGSHHLMCFKKTFSERFEEEKRVMMQWLEAL